MNNLKKITLIANHIPNHLTLHAIFSDIRWGEQLKPNHFDDENFKIWNVDKQIYLIIPEDKILGKLKPEYKHYVNGKLFTLKVKELNRQDYIFTTFHMNDVVCIEGILNYHIKYKEGNTVKLQCPINLEGKFKTDAKNKSVKQHFLKYLTDSIGIDCYSISEKTEQFRLERIFFEENEQHLDVNHEHKKVLFKNLIYVYIKGKIDNPDTLNRLQYSSIGKRRSYGFGNLFIQKIQ